VVLVLGQNKKAEIGDIVRVHDWNYLRTLQAKCAELDADEVDNWVGGVF